MSNHTLNESVEVVRWVSAPPADDDFGPAARHATSRPTFWQRTVQTGQHSLASASEEIAAQVDLVAERMMAALEQRQEDRRTERMRTGSPEPVWEVADVEVSFGVQLTGEATVAVFSGSAEASAQITLTFARRPVAPPP